MVYCVAFGCNSNSCSSENISFLESSYMVIQDMLNIRTFLCAFFVFANVLVKPVVCMQTGD